MSVQHPDGTADVSACPISTSASADTHTGTHIGTDINTHINTDRWRRARRVLLCAYAVAYLVWFLNYGVIIDRISVLVSVALLLVIVHVGRPLRSWRVLSIDLSLYAVMWLAYDETRGAADRLGMPLQVESVRDIDRAMFGGIDPNVWMQDRFFSAEHVRWYDVVASVVYFSHFVLPVAVIAVLWVRRRHQWIRCMRRFATVLLIGCASFVLLPTAPPWMAAGGSAAVLVPTIAPLERPAGRGWDALQLDSFVHAWETGRDWANPVAAMPSLHAGFSLFVVVFFFPAVRRRWVRVAMLAYPVTMGIALVYLAEHWVIDVFAGWAVVGASFALWAPIERCLATRRAAGVTEPWSGGTLAPEERDAALVAHPPLGGSSGGGGTDGIVGIGGELLEAAPATTGDPVDRTVRGAR